MKLVIQVTCSALFLSGAQLAAADDAAASPMSLARSLQPASVYPALEETLKAAEAKLDAYYEKHLAELPKVVAKHTEADKAALQETMSQTTLAAQQGLSAWHGHRKLHGSAAFLQRRAQSGEGDGVKVSVAGVSQPGKSVHKRVNRLASKWIAAGDKVFAYAATGLDQVSGGLHKQLQASLQQTSDMALHRAFGQAGAPASSFLLGSSSTGSSIDVKLSADDAAWPVPSSLILDVQDKSSYYLAEACSRIASSFASVAKADLSAIRETLALNKDTAVTNAASFIQRREAAASLPVINVELDASVPAPTSLVAAQMSAVNSATSLDGFVSTAMAALAKLKAAAH
jgi:hypothetical protein